MTSYTNSTILIQSKYDLHSTSQLPTFFIAINLLPIMTLTRYAKFPTSGELTDLTNNLDL